MSIVLENPMTEVATYLLRMPPDLKEAAKALTQVAFTDPSLHRHIWPRSVNQALIYLAKKGVWAMMPHLEAELARVTEEYKALEEIMTFLINNPSTKSALPSNFPEGSRAKTYIDDRTHE